MEDANSIHSSGEEIFTDTPFTEFLQANHSAKSENYGYLGDREQEVLERLIDLIRVTEIRNLGRPTGTYHVALGGKNFGHCLLIKYLIFGGGANPIENVEVHLPWTKMLGSAFYYTFLHHNKELQALLRKKYQTKGYSQSDYEDIKEGFRNAKVPTVIKEELLVLLQKAQQTSTSSAPAHPARTASSHPPDCSTAWFTMTTGSTSPFTVGSTTWNV